MYRHFSSWIEEKNSGHVVNLWMTSSSRFFRRAPGIQNVVPVQIVMEIIERIAEAGCYLGGKISSDERGWEEKHRYSEENVGHG